MKVLVTRWAGDEAERFLRVELPHHHHRPPNTGRQGEPARRRVIERARDEVHVRARRSIALRTQHGRRVHRAADGALRLPGGAAGVDHGAAQPLRGVRRRQARVAPRATRSSSGPPRAGARGRGGSSGGRGGSGAYRLGDREERIAHEDGGGVGIVEDVGDFFGGQPVVHRHRHRADGARGGGREHALQRIVRVDDRVLAAPTPSARSE